MTYNVFGETLKLAQSNPTKTTTRHAHTGWITHFTVHTNMLSRIFSVSTMAFVNKSEASTLVADILCLNCRPSQPSTRL